MSPLGVVLMTALPPTEGHLALCEFARDYMRGVGGELLVLMCVLPDEPPGRGSHRDALATALGADGHRVRVEIQFSNDPQGPKGSDDDEFWQHWVRTILRQSGRSVSHVFSSESYGAKLATSIGADHIVFDPHRVITCIRATEVRQAPVRYFDMIVKPLRDQLRTRICIFGQESTGKTTLTRDLANATNSVACPEWARPYLEDQKDSATTLERMDVIAQGQVSQERAALLRVERAGSPFVFLDTDLLSTIGYMELYWNERTVSKRSSEWFRIRADLDMRYTPADHYLVTSDSIPFVPDPLRYGGSKRETTRNYWIALLDRYKLPYTILPDGLSREETTDVARLESSRVLERRCGFVNYERRMN
jgi:HTH-type transcriptional repressor of NAD biosynthesis genes